MYWQWHQRPYLIFDTDIFTLTTVFCPLYIRILLDWLSISRGHIWRVVTFRISLWLSAAAALCYPVLGIRHITQLRSNNLTCLTVWHTFTLHHYNNSWRLPALSTLALKLLYTHIKEALQKLSLAFLGLIHHQISCPFFTHFCLNSC